MSDGNFKGSRSAATEAALAVRMERAMREKLAIHTHKAHWSRATEMYLAGRLADEVGELLRAIAEGGSPSEVWAEAADVANLAAMLADNHEGDLP